MDRVLHHEVFHFIQHGNEDLFNRVNWEKLNESNFKYQDCSTCTEKLGLNYSNSNNGKAAEEFLAAVQLQHYILIMAWQGCRGVLTLQLCT